MKWSVDEAKSVGGVKSMEMKKINRKYWLMPVIMFSLMLLWHFNCYATSNECEHQYGAAGYEIVKSERREAGCTADGYEEYWSCNKCHKLFSDAAAKTEIVNPVKLPSEGHDLVKSDRKEAGCTADGHEAYWQCSKCHRFFADEKGNTRISEPKVISKTGHSLKKVEKKEASCTESGYEAYWKCQNETCQRLFSDEG